MEMKMTILGTNPFSFFGVVLEVSEDLVSWQAISTNAVSSGSVRMIDPAAAGRVQRFYRVPNSNKRHENNSF